MKRWRYVDIYFISRKIARVYDKTVKEAREHGRYMVNHNRSLKGVKSVVGRDR